MRRYNPKEIEPKWQKVWADSNLYVANMASDKQKFIGFGMFNYPSGAGIHIGHGKNFTLADIVVRTKRQQGFEAYSPVGFDSFGLPAENYAIKTGTSPRVTTDKAIANYRKQYQAMGWGMDWTKEIDTSQPEYYKWTQWIFLKLFEKGLAYQKESLQWWCPFDKTVLADEQVEAGRCWRCGHLVEKKQLKQWFFKITEYIDEILEATDALDWTESVKTMQKNWIGRSLGVEVDFRVAEKDGSIKVYTTRVDTIFGATFLVLAPEHPLVNDITSDEQKTAVEQYVKEAVKHSDVERQVADREKTGVFSGAYAINPANNQPIPIWVADYVLFGYGTGAIMAVPAHDQRDNEFAKKFNLPIVNVINPVAIRADAEGLADFKQKQKVVAVVENDQGEILTINWGDKLGGRLTIGGTIEGDESPETTAIREVAEETGYSDLEVLEVGQESFYYKYVAFSKQEAHEVEAKFVHLRLKSDARQEVKLDDSEKNNFKVEWISHEVADKEITEPLHRYAYEKFIEGVCYSGEGLMTNSGVYDNIPSEQAREKIVADLNRQGVAEEKINYKVHDWLISRQRYWGAPIPIIHCTECGAVPVPEDQLPVILPEVKNYAPTGEAYSVLATIPEWVNIQCPKCSGPAKRETDTMDGYACSSWYFLRYIDPHNKDKAWDEKLAAKWMPVDFYNGGDHAIAHLLYARFFMRFFFKLGLVNTPEPFQKMYYHAKILAPDGSAFSKSKGNGVDPLDLINSGYGADSVRTYIMFIAPPDMESPWSNDGVPGTYRFLNRLWSVTQEFLESKEVKNRQSSGRDPKLVAVHKAVKKVTEDIEAIKFNTAVAAMMESVNELYRLKVVEGFGDRAGWQASLEALVQIVAPFAPHLAEELWHNLGHEDSVHVGHWPTWDEALLAEDKLKIAVQVNGKLRAVIEVSAGTTEAEITNLALQNEKVAAFTGSQPGKVIYIKDKLINFVV